MLKKELVLSLIFSILIFNSLAQSWNLQTGNLLYEGYSYPDAIKRLEYIKDKDLDTKRKLAQAYYYTGNYEKAESYYAKVASDKQHTAEDIFNYASVLAVNKKYEQAQIQNERLAAEFPSDSRATKRMSNRNFYQNLLSEEKNILVKNLNINTKHADFGAWFLGEKIMFTSSNTSSFAKEWALNELPYLEILIANTDSVRELKNPERLFKDVEKQYNRGPATADSSGKYVIYTENIPNTKDAKILRLKLMETHKTGKVWSKPTEFAYNNKEYSTGHAAVSPEGSMLFFVSDKPGGIGKTDIYVCHRQDSAWSEPINLGNKVNTEGKEMFPFYHPSGYLFFASDGQPGLGGLDIFMIKMQGSQFAGNAVNMGKPVNTNLDDFSFVLNAEETAGYFASNREGGKGNDDIYAFEIPIPEKPKFVVGTVTDKEGTELPGTDLYLSEKNSAHADTSVSECGGYYQYEIKAEKEYTLLARTPFYYDSEVKFSIEKNQDTVIQNIVLRKIPNPSFRLTVVEKSNQIPMKDVRISIEDLTTGERRTALSSADGTLNIELTKTIKDTIRYKILLEYPDFLARELVYEQEIKDFVRYDFSAELYPVEVGTDVAVMEDVTIYFDYKKWNIRSDAEPQLEKIVSLMNANPSIELELSSHTDCRGSNDANMKLSDNRAKASADYIRKKISNPDRITGKGYGETKPVNDCDCAEHACTEEEYQANRRTEIKIVKK